MDYVHSWDRYAFKSVFMFSVYIFQCNMAFILILSKHVGGLTVLMLAAFNFLNKFRCAHYDGGAAQYGQMDSARAPLLSNKDDDLSSWGSSYDSVSQDEADLEELLASGSQEGKLKDSENGNNTRRLCGICFDAPRDCFFLPCGHCVACFECGTRYSTLRLVCFS